jgi:hypothetical protein
MSMPKTFRWYGDPDARTGKVRSAVMIIDPSRPFHRPRVQRAEGSGLIGEPAELI